MRELKGEDGKTLKGISDKIGFEQLDLILENSYRISDVRELNKKSLMDVVSEFREKTDANTESLAIGKEIREHIHKLGQEGKIGTDVAKLWMHPELIAPPPINNGAAAKIYETVEMRNGVRANDEQQAIVQNAILKLAKRYPRRDVDVQSSFGTNPVINEHSILGQREGFVHFNSSKRGNGVDLRCYISLNPEKRDIALKAWHDSLKESEVKDDLYYKVGMTDEHIDDIVIYKSDVVSDDKFKRILQIFSEKSLDEDLVDKNNTLPTGRKIADEIAIAPETKYVNSYLKSMGENKYSYNQFVARMLELSACVASQRMENHKMRYAKTSDGVKSGKIHSTKSYDFRHEMRDVFREFMMLSKINPDTMLPDEYGDELPSWAQIK